MSCSSPIIAVRRATATQWMAKTASRAGRPRSATSASARWLVSAGHRRSKRLAISAGPTAVMPRFSPRRSSPTLLQGRGGDRAGDRPRCSKRGASTSPITRSSARFVGIGPHVQRRLTAASRGRSAPVLLFTAPRQNVRDRASAEDDRRSKARAKSRVVALQGPRPPARRSDARAQMLTGSARSCDGDRTTNEKGRPRCGPPLLSDR